ncbi:MAG TPA: GAF domain-containing protein, partial [Pseudomonadales bacterium]|nr:GAF domain-containing protein [Pseudomonadales bacterium]
MREQLHIQILEAISEIQFAYFDNPDPFHVFELALNYLLSISQSEFGFIGERLQKSDGAPYLKIFSISNISWNDDARALYAKLMADGMEFAGLNSMLGWILLNGKSIVSNDPAQHPAASGLSQGHPPLQRFLGLPIFFRDQFIGLVGLANKAYAYSDNDILVLQPLLNTIGNLVNSIRLGREHEARLKAEERFRIIFNHSADAFFLLEADRVVDCNTTAVKMLRCQN